MFSFPNRGPMLLALLLAIPAIFQAQGPSKRLLIKNVNVVPMHLGGVLEAKDVVVENGIIMRMRQHTEEDTTHYDLGQIDGSGKYLAPAYADSHVHLPEKEDLKRFFLMNLMNGVTTLRSMRGEAWHLEIDQDAPYTPHLLLSTPPISRRDEDLTDSQMNSQFESYKEAGFDFIKVLSGRDQAHFEQLLNAARNNQLDIAGHSPHNIDALDILSSGQFLSIEHLGGLLHQPDFKSLSKVISQTVAHGVYHCATLDWYAIGKYETDELRQREGLAYIKKSLVSEWEKGIAEEEASNSPEDLAADRSKATQSFAARLSYLRYIYEQGVKLLLSPDASGAFSIPGFGIHTEMGYYAEAGLNAKDILKAASYHLAEMCGEADQWGNIRVGMQPDMVLLSKNPLEDIANANTVEGVVFKGQYHPVEEFRKALEGLRE